MKKTRIGFIGQGWIGKNYADDFENRGYSVTRYALEEPYRSAEKDIASCDIVFIAVPTPTTAAGFYDGIVRSVLPRVGKGKIAVIKSTMIIGQTALIQKDFPHCIILHSPEFLSESTAAHDAAHPERNIIGIPAKTPKNLAAAKKVLSVLPKAPFSLLMSSAEAELIKYSHNVHGYIQVVFANLLYDFSQKFSMDWEVLFKAFSADPLMVPRYLKPLHKSGRGAGGNCFIKDFEAFIAAYKKSVSDPYGLKVFESIRDKNIDLLIHSRKDMEKIRDVYGSRKLSDFGAGSHSSKRKSSVKKSRT